MTDALRSALAEALHDQFAPIACVSAQDIHTFAECDIKDHWLSRGGDAAAHPAVLAALAGSEPAGLRDRLRTALVENGADSTANLGLHSWRCEYYLDIAPEKGGGPCDCVDTLLDDLVSAAMAASPTATVDEPLGWT